MSTEVQVEPTVLERIEVTHDERQFVQVPESVDAMCAVAQWVRSFGDTETSDIGPDGFRYRTVAGNTIGRWVWIEPGMWLVRIGPEFDLPYDDPHPWGEGWEHKSGPPLPRWDDDCDDEAGAS